MTDTKYVYVVAYSDDYEFSLLDFVVYQNKEDAEARRRSMGSDENIVIYELEVK